MPGDQRPDPRNMDSARHPVDPKHFQEWRPPDRDQYGGKLSQNRHLLGNGVKKTGHTLDHVQIGRMVLPTRHFQHTLPCHFDKTLSCFISHDGKNHHPPSVPGNKIQAM